MTKKLFISLSLLVIFSFFTNAEPNILKASKSAICQIKIYFENNSNVSIPVVGMADQDEDYTFTNVPANGNGIGGFNDGTPSIELLVQLPSSHPAGRIRITDQNEQLVTCTNVQANSSLIYLYFLVPSCELSYYLRFETISC